MLNRHQRAFLHPETTLAGGWCAPRHEARGRGAEVRGAEGRGAEGRGAEGRGAEGRGAEGLCCEGPSFFLLVA